MNWHHFYFETADGKRVAEYSTDEDPPVVGDIVKFKQSINGGHDIKYRVVEVWNIENEVRVDYFFKVEALAG